MVMGFLILVFSLWILLDTNRITIPDMNHTYFFSIGCAYLIICAFYIIIQTSIWNHGQNETQRLIPPPKPTGLLLPSFSGMIARTL